MYDVFLSMPSNYILCKQLTHLNISTYVLSITAKPHILLMNHDVYC